MAFPVGFALAVILTLYFATWALQIGIWLVILAVRLSLFVAALAIGIGLLASTGVRKIWRDSQRPARASSSARPAVR